jgi:hypothetical protein
MREKDLEEKFRDACREAGFLVRKLRWTAQRGAPDRIVFGRNQAGNPFIVFVEMKAPGGKLQDYQIREHNKMREHGAKVFTIETEHGIKLFVQLVLS